MSGISRDPTPAASSGGGNAATLFQRPGNFVFSGDSIGDYLGTRNGLSAVWWAATELYPCDYVTLAVTAVGGTSSSNLIAAETLGETEYPAQITAIQALAASGPIDVVYTQTFQNDSITSVAVAESFFANLETFANLCWAAGVTLVVIHARPPKTPITSAATVHLNRLLEKFCADNEGAYFIDTMAAWVNASAAHTSGMPWRGTASSPDAFSNDNTHPTPIAERFISPQYVPILERFCRPIEPSFCGIVAYDDSGYPYGNVLGVDGEMIGTLGQYNGVNNAGVCGSNDPAVSFINGRRWFLTDQNSVVATPSIVTGEDGHLYQRIDFSGTASAEATVRLRMGLAYDVTEGTFVAQGKMIASGVTGVTNFGMAWSVFTDADAAGSGTEEMELNRTFVFTSEPTTFSNADFGTKNTDFFVTFSSGTTATGYILCGRASIRKVD